MTTKQLDKSIHDFIVGCGAVPTFLGYGGFPASACISINDEIIHGIPSHKRVIREGDIVSVDVGATFNGFVGDTAYTFAVGDISEEAADLLRVTEASLYAAIDAAKVGARLGDVSHTVEEYCGSRGYGIVREYCGHGIGREMHEDPEVPNYGKPGHGMRLMPGMTFCIWGIFSWCCRWTADMPSSQTANGGSSLLRNEKISVISSGRISSWNWTVSRIKSSEMC